MTERKESMLKKSITVGEVLSMAIALVGASIIFYTTVQVRLSALELRMAKSETESGEYRKEQQKFQDRIESKIDGIKDEINTIKVQVTQKKDK